MDPFGGVMVRRLIARGDSAEVLHAHHADGAPLVIKVAREDVSHSAGAIRREGLWLQDNKHPGIVEISACDLECERPWFALPWHRPSPWSEAFEAVDRPAAASEGSPGAARRHQLELLRHLSDTLAWLHGRGVVHCDLKPANIVIDANDFPVLIDFGIWRQGAPVRGPAIATDAAGTRAYCAPEQLRGEIVDGRCDLYALGVMLLQTLTGEPASGGATDRSHLERLLACVRDCSERLRALALSLLAPERHDRPSYADEVAQVIGAEVSVGPRQGLPEPPPYLHRSDLRGRADVVSRFQDELSCARAGRGNLLLLAGVSGSGKTRMLEAVARAANREDFLVVDGRCGDLGAQAADGSRDAPSLLGFLPFLRHVALHTPQTDPVVAPLLRSRAPLLARYEKSLERWLAPDERRADDHASPEHVQATILALLHAFAEDRPTALCLDDIQWADELTLGVLQSLAEKPWVAPSCLVVATARSEEMPAVVRRIAEQPRVVELSVRDLDPASTREMVASMLGGSRALDEFAEALHEQSAGTPLLVVASLEHLVSSKALERRDATWYPVGVSQALRVPATLAELMTRRLEAAGPGANALVSASAILGRRFDLRIASELSGLDHTGVSDALAELVSLRIVEDEGAWFVRFVHDRLLEHAYAAIGKDDRTALHRHALEILRSSNSATAAELARHARDCGDHGQAFTHLIEAAMEAVAHGRYSQADQYVDRAVTERNQSGVPLGEPERARITMVRTEIADGTYDYARCEALAREGLAALGFAVPRTPVRWLFNLAGAALQQAGLRCGALGSRSVSESIRDRFDRAAYFYHSLGGCLIYDDSPMGGLICQLHAANAAERSHNWARAARSGAVLGLAWGTIGWRRLAERYFGRARRWSEQAADDGNSMFCDTLEGLYYHNYSEPESARVAARRTKTMLPRGPSITMLQNLGICGIAALGAGDMTDARRYVSQLHELGRLTDLSQITGEGRVLGVAILLQDGELEAAAREGLATADSLDIKGSLIFHCSALSIAATALAALGRRGEAASAIDKVRQLLPAGGGKNIAAGWVHSYLPEAMILMAESAATPEERSRWLNSADRAIKVAFGFVKMVPRWRPKALYHRAKWLLSRGRTAAALKYALRAQGLATRMRQPFESAQALALSAGIQRSQGKPNIALEEQAVQTFRDLGSRWHLTSI